MTRQELGYSQNMRKTVLSGLKVTSSRLRPTSSFTGCWSQPSGIGSLCILGWPHQGAENHRKSVRTA